MNRPSAPSKIAAASIKIEEDEDENEISTVPQRQQPRFITRKSNNERYREHKRQQTRLRKESKECRAMLAFSEKQHVMVDLADKANMRGTLWTTRRQTKLEVRQRRGQDEYCSSKQRRRSEDTVAPSRSRARSTTTAISSEEENDIPESSANDKPKKLDTTVTASRKITSSSRSTLSNQNHTTASPADAIPSGTIVVKLEQ